MSIILTYEPRQNLLPTGNYVSRCYQIVEIGTIKEVYLGQEIIVRKGLLGWEIFVPDDEGSYVISKEFTLTLHEKSNLRKLLESWQGRELTEEELRQFDLTKVLGEYCLLNIIQKTSKAGRTYSDISSVAPLPKGFQKPTSSRPLQLLTYSSFNWDFFNCLPPHVKEKVKSSKEFTALIQGEDKGDDLPW